MSSCGKGYSAKILKGKVEILCGVDAGKTSKFEIAKKHDSPNSTLPIYIKNKTGIEDTSATEPFASSRSILRSAKHPELQHALVPLIKEMRSQGIRPSGPVVMAKASDYAPRLLIEDANTSKGLLYCFRDSHDIGSSHLVGRKRGCKQCNICDVAKQCFAVALERLFAA